MGGHPGALWAGLERIKEAVAAPRARTLTALPIPCLGEKTRQIFACFLEVTRTLIYGFLRARGR